MNRSSSAFLLLFPMAVACGPKAEAPAPDNTAVNQRDVNQRDTEKKALTAGDQPQSGPDLKVTQEVRQAVVADDSLSMTAKNVKIITKESVVTLRGPVASEKERAVIGSLAKQVAGVTRVDNELEVASEK